MSIQIKRHASSQRPVRRLRHLHRITGLFILLPVIFLVATGIPLQYTDELDLGRAGVSWNWVHSAYSITAPDSAMASASATQIGAQLFVAGHSIDHPERMIGALSSPQLEAVALEQTLILVTSDLGTAPETIALPNRATKFGGHLPRQIYIESAQGVLASTDLGVSWESTTATPGPWAPIVVAKDVRFWQDRYKSSRVSWERWLVDLHSGRFFGPFGEFIMSLASIALSLVAISGLVTWIFLRRTR